MSEVYKVWQIIEKIVERTRGGLVKLSPSRIRRMAERSYVAVDRRFMRIVYTVLNAALKDCKAFPLAKRPDGGNRELYYVYNKECVRKMVQEVAAV